MRKLKNKIEKKNKMYAKYANKDTRKCCLNLKNRFGSI